MDKPIMLRIEVTDSERKRIKQAAQAEGRTLSGYCRGKLGLSFGITQAVNTQTRQTQAQNKQTSASIQYDPAKSAEILDWRAMDMEEKKQQHGWALEDGYKAGQGNHPIDQYGNRILKNAAGEWVCVEDEPKLPAGANRKGLI